MLNRFSSWYTVILDLTTRSNVNIYNFITANSQWTNNSKKLRAFITIPENNTIYGTAGTPAITIPNNFRYFDRVYLIVKGAVSGQSGAAGIRGCGASNGSNGGNGGTAIRSQSSGYVSISTENSGVVRGGGGGGGGGGGYTFTQTVPSCCECTNGCGSPYCCNGRCGCFGPGFCGGGYWAWTHDCGGGVFIGSCCFNMTVVYNRCGGNGGTGEGYNQPATNGLVGQTNCGNGGNGGIFGQNGQNGQNGSSSNGGDGGLSGYYIERLGTGTFDITGVGYAGRLL